MISPIFSKKKYFHKNIKINPTWHSQPSFYAKTGRDSVDQLPTGNIYESCMYMTSLSYHHFPTCLILNEYNMNNIFPLCCEWWVCTHGTRVWVYDTTQTQTQTPREYVELHVLTLYFTTHQKILCTFWKNERNVIQE